MSYRPFRFHLDYCFSRKRKHARSLQTLNATAIVGLLGTLYAVLFTVIAKTASGWKDNERFTAAFGMPTGPVSRFDSSDQATGQLGPMFVLKEVFVSGVAVLTYTAQDGRVADQVGFAWSAYCALCTAVSIADCLRNYSGIIFPRSVDGAAESECRRALPKLCRFLSGISGKHRSRGRTETSVDKLISIE